MTYRTILALAALLALPATATAQHGHAQSSFRAPAEASQYDFLVGQWELKVEVPPKGLAELIHGAPRLMGTWKAWRALDGWGIEDELRITDRAGNPVAFAHSVRYYDGAAGHWTLSALDVYRGRFTSGTGEWREGEMHLRSSGTDSEGQAYLARTRIYDITADGFRLQQDRSSDDGRSWTEGALRIEARRVAAAASR